MSQESGTLQRLGVSYAQVVDYYSKEYVATLVSSTDYLQTAHSNQRRFKSALWY